VLTKDIKKKNKEINSKKLFDISYIFFLRD